MWTVYTACLMYGLAGNRIDLKLYNIDIILLLVRSEVSRIGLPMLYYLWSGRLCADLFLLKLNTKLLQSFI